MELSLPLVPLPIDPPFTLPPSRRRPSPLLTNGAPPSCALEAAVQGVAAAPPSPPSRTAAELVPSSLQCCSPSPLQIRQPPPQPPSRRPPPQPSGGTGRRSAAAAEPGRVGGVRSGRARSCSDGRIRRRQALSLAISARRQAAGGPSGVAGCAWRRQVAGAAAPPVDELGRPMDGLAGLVDFFFGFDLLRQASNRFKK